MKIAIITPCIKCGGLGSATQRLFTALRNENYQVFLIDLSRKTVKVMYSYLNDLKYSIRVINAVDTMIYLGSIPYLSHIFAKLSSKKVILFINGYIHYEQKEALKDALRFLDVRRSIVIALNWMLFLLGSFLVDFFIFPCYGTRENSKANLKKSVVIPLWLTQDDLKVLETIRKNSNKPKDTVRIISYSSYVRSPKLLTTTDLLKLAQILRTRVNRKIEFIIIDPKAPFQRIGNIQIVKALPKQEFLKLLASSHLYIDTIIDDELRYSTLEAMALGVPVAKLVHTKYWNELDFKYELFTSSVKEFINVISNYVNNVEKLYPQYSDAVRHYVLNKRLWIHIKPLLLEVIEKATK